MQAIHLRAAASEAAFYLLPTVVRTYAPEGETPVLRYPYGEHLHLEQLPVTLAG